MGPAPDAAAAFAPLAKLIGTDLHLSRRVLGEPALESPELGEALRGREHGGRESVEVGR